MEERVSTLVELLIELAGTRAELSALKPGSPAHREAEVRYAGKLQTLHRQTPPQRSMPSRGPLDAAQKAADILRFEVPSSHRQKLGRAVTLAKKGAVELSRPALAPVLEVQRACNLALLEVLAGLLEQARAEGPDEPRWSPEEVRRRLQPHLSGTKRPLLGQVFAPQWTFNQRAAALCEVAARGVPHVSEANALVGSLFQLVDPLKGAKARRVRLLLPLWREVFRRQVAFNTEVVLILANLLNGRPPVAPPPTVEYRSWYGAREPSDIARARQALPTLKVGPTVSLLLPAWETPPRVLEQAIRSVQAQLYDRWELCVVDDGSRSGAVRRVVEAHAKRDARVRYLRLEGKGSIARATNAALEMARGEWVAFLDHDDALAPHALAELLLRLDREPELEWLYSDEDRLSADGRSRHSPSFKPDFSPELLRSLNYICHLVMVRTRLARELGGLREGFQGAQDYDFLLRLSERSAKVAHVPQVLYHWRQSDLSLSHDEERLRLASAAGARALREHVQRTGGGDAVVSDFGRGEYRVRYPVLGEPLVSIIVPFKDRPELLDVLVQTLLPRTRYQNFELLLVSNDSRDPRTFGLLETLVDPRIRKLEWNHPFNYPAMNNWAARQAKGEFLVFLNNDIEVEDPQWLHELVGQAQRPGVGMVGPKLKFPDGSIQHAGVVVGICGNAAHPFWRFPDAGHRTPFGTADWNRNYLAVTSACVILTRELFFSLGGYDEHFRVCGSDVDLGIRTFERGLQVIYTAGTWLFHHESASRRNVEIPEEDLWHSVVRYRRWLEQGDPFFNPNLDLTTTDCGLRRDDRSAPELAAQALCLATSPARS